MPEINQKISQIQDNLINDVDESFNLIYETDETDQSFENITSLSGDNDEEEEEDEILAKLSSSLDFLLEDEEFYQNDPISRADGLKDLKPLDDESLSDDFSEDEEIINSELEILFDSPNISTLV